MADDKYVYEYPEDEDSIGYWRRFWATAGGILLTLAFGTLAFMFEEGRYMMAGMVFVCVGLTLMILRMKVIGFTLMLCALVFTIVNPFIFF